MVHNFLKFSCEGLVLYQLCPINVSILKAAEAGSKSLEESENFYSC